MTDPSGVANRKPLLVSGAVMIVGAVLFYTAAGTQNMLFAWIAFPVMTVPLLWFLPALWKASRE